MNCAYSDGGEAAKAGALGLKYVGRSAVDGADHARRRFGREVGKKHEPD